MRILDIVQGQLPVGGEPGDPYAYQPERTGTIFQAAVEETARELGDRRGIVDAHVERARAAADREVRVAKLGRHRARHLALLLQACRDFLRHPAQLVVETLAVDDVALERVLDTDRDSLAVQLERARIDPVRSVAQLFSDAPWKDAAEQLVAHRRELADGCHTGSTQPLLRFRADARQLPHLERGQEAGFLTRHDDHEPAGLAAVA